jgi:signal transduction histidine kinase/CheY-like chemotaxis protein
MIWIADQLEVKGISEQAAQTLREQLSALKPGVEEAHIIEDWNQDSNHETWGEIRAAFLQQGVRASLIVPIKAEGKSIGGMCLVDREPRLWSAEEITLIESAGSQVGGAAERLGLLETIQEQARLLQGILDTVRGGIFTIDSNRRILVANAMAREHLTLLAGASPGDVLTQLGGRPFSEFLESREDGLPHEIEIGEHERRFFEIYPNPYQVGSEKRGWTILLREVTNVRQVRHRVQEQERQASVGQLAAGIAHDFNNIIAAIILYTEMLLQMKEVPERGQKRLTTIMSQAQRAAQLTRQILDFSRRGIMEPHPMDLVPLLKEMVKLLKRTLPENINVNISYEDDDYIINSDPGRMQQVFMNLAFNARDAMPSGGDLRFSLSRMKLEEGVPTLLPEISPGDWVRIQVSDTGVGISGEHLPHIFDPFFTTKPPGQGSGLGLAQVLGIVKQNNGHIDVTSTTGRGAVFTIYLPALPPSALTGIIPEPTEPLEGRMETILVVEDDRALREALCATLESMNYQVFGAGDGQEALEVFDRNQGIDLVLSDLVMPKMGGVALYGTLSSRYPDIKMIVMTGYPLAEGDKELLERGILAWLHKPIDSDELAQTLRRVLSKDN